jgi:hypothetical protein
MIARPVFAERHNLHKRMIASGELSILIINVNFARRIAMPRKVNDCFVTITKITPGHVILKIRKVVDGKFS